MGAPHKSLNAILNAIADAQSLNELRRVYLGAVSEYAEDATSIWKIQDATAARKGDLERMKTLTKNPAQSPTRKSKFIATRSKAKALRDAQSAGISAPVAVKAPGGYVVYSAYAANPAAKKSTRIARKGVSKKRYVNRPSQITGETPTKRLKKRREMMDVLASSGYTRVFPNPSYVSVQALKRTTWGTVALFPDTEVGRAMAAAYARALGKTGKSVRIVRED